MNISTANTKSILSLIILFFALTVTISCSKENDAEEINVSFSLVELSPKDSATTFDSIIVKWRIHEEKTLSYFTIQDDYISIHESNLNTIEPNSEGVYSSGFMLATSGHRTLQFTVTDNEGNIGKETIPYYVRYESEMNWKKPEAKISFDTESIFLYDSSASPIYLCPINTDANANITFSPAEYPLGSYFINSEKKTVEDGKEKQSSAPLPAIEEQSFTIGATDIRGNSQRMTFFIKPINPTITTDTITIIGAIDLVYIPSFNLGGVIPEEQEQEKIIEISCTETVNINSEYYSSENGQTTTKHYQLSEILPQNHSFFSKTEHQSYHQELTEDNAVLVYQNNGIPAGFFQLSSRTDTHTVILFHRYTPPSTN